MDRLRQALFQSKFDVDKRVPSIFFSLPYFGNYAITDFEHLFWVQLATLVILGSIVNIIIAIIVYKLIVQQRGSWQAFLVGYGFVCPFLLLLPFWISQELDLRNPAIIVSGAAASVLLFFRCLEAMYGTGPAFSTQSLRNYCFYFGATVNFELHPKTGALIPLTRKSARERSFKFLRLFIETSLWYSLLLHFDYSVFPSKQRQNILDFFYWGNILNNLLVTFLTSHCLEVGAVGIGLATSAVSGVQTAELQYFPLTRSLSPSDFWGNRWNILVSWALKRGVFQPLRKHGWSWPVSALACFAASGLLHEYIILLVASQAKRTQIQSNDMQIFWKQLLFFLWNAVVLIMEQLVKNTAAIRWMATNLPAAVRTALVIMTVLPLAHLFTDVYIDINIFNGLSLGFPRIVKLEE